MNKLTPRIALIHATALAVEQLAGDMRAQLARYGALIKQAGITAE